MRGYLIGLLVVSSVVVSHQSVAQVSKSAVMLVKDSTGKVIGPYLSAPNPFIGNSEPEDNVLIRTSTRSFAVHLTSSDLGLPSKTVVYFETSTCSGAAYLTYSFPYEIGMPALPFAAVVGTTAYIGGTTHNGGTAASRRYSNGTQAICEPSTGGLFSENFVPVIATFNMANLKFTPPFSVR